MEQPFVSPDPTAQAPVGAQTMALTWTALHEAAATIAGMAGRNAGPLPGEVRDFPAAIRHAGGWRLTLAEQGLSDLAAMMVPGLAALLQVSARGADAPGAAEALWQEFVRARDGLLSLVE